MKQIRRFFQMKKIRNRFIITQFGVIIPLLLILGGIIYGQTKSLLIKTNSDSYYKVLEGADRILEQYLENYKDIARTILANEVLQQELTENAVQRVVSENMEQLRIIKIRQSLEKYVTSFSGIRSLHLYDRNGWGMSINNQLQIGGSSYEEICSAVWFQKATELNGKELFVGYNVMNGNSGEISCVKLLRNLETLEPIGMMILNFDKSELNEIFSAHQEEKGIYAIVEGTDKSPIVLVGAVQILEGKEFVHIAAGDDKEIYVSDYESTCSGWQLMYMVRHSDILYEAENIRNIVFIALLAGMCVLLIMTIVVCSRITRPLYQLREDIIRVGEGERSLQNDFPDDEIGIIGKEFQKMVNEKLSLSERVTLTELKNKEAELELLQSNINPHFLYNTLDSLYWMAILHDVEDIAELTKALGDVFRIALSKGEKMISIREELHFINRYLYIQNIRFEGKIHFLLQVDESLLEKKILKLLLQPFVENAVYHGLEPKLAEGMIEIKVYESEGYICFEINDNGVGMEVEDALSSGYALRNSIDRIKLVYGEKAEIMFNSRPGEGVRVKIAIPEEEK